ncbi:MAG: ABC transporter substrate-binding protein [Butyricicoccus sp.]|nr:ABC transporter substrate-binding protein [Butyricicoccus sp.]
MKKTARFCAFLLAAVLLLSLAGCGSSSAEDDNVVYVYNWGEYIEEETLAMFEEETGIRVVYNTFETNEGLYSRLKTESYDVIIPSDYMISRMIHEDMLQPLDYSKIPNFSLIGEEYTYMDYDPEQKYSVPYTWGVVGIVYNTTKVDEEDLGSWDLLWNEKYRGKTAMFDNSRDAFGLLLKYLGYSNNTTDPDELREAAQLLIDTKDNYQGFFMDQLLEKLPNEELVAAPYYNGDAATMVDENPDLGFYVPEEGSNLFFDAMCIPKNARNVDNAHKFIDFMCRTDIAIMNNDYIWYSNPHTGVIESLDEETLSDPLYYPPKENTEVYVNLPEETNELYVELWIDVLMS